MRKRIIPIVFLVLLVVCLILFSGIFKTYQYELADSTYVSLLEKLDREYPGMGIVDYGNNEIEHIAKAYAMVLLAELNRQQYDGRPDIPLYIEQAGQWLINHADLDDDGTVGWGVPVAWDAYGDGTINPAHTEYTISTAIVIDALLEWRKTKKGSTERIDTIIKMAVMPYLNEEILTPSGLFPYSLEKSDQQYDTFNPAAYLAGQFQRFSVICEDPVLEDSLRYYADKTVASLIKNKKTTWNGNWYWAYSIQEDSNPNDIAHAGYIMYGLDVYKRNGGRLSEQIDTIKIYSHLNDFFPTRSNYLRAWPIVRKDILAPARSYGIGMAWYLLNTQPCCKKHLNNMIGFSHQYLAADGGYSKYPLCDIEDIYSPTSKDTIQIAEYNAYMLRALSYALFQ